LIIIIKSFILAILVGIMVRLQKILEECHHFYYIDHDLSRDNLIQTKNEIQYFPLRTLLQNPM
jgi:hypothetical protein